MSQADPMRWVWRGITGTTLVTGWVFIFWQNNFNMTVPVVVIALGYLAVVLGVTSLWRVGAAAVGAEDDSPGAWTRPVGARGELEKEKRTLLKAIKEAEFDLAMGKLSKEDADDLIRMYRGRAIELIKELDRLDAGGAGSARDQIEREVHARIALENKTSKKDKRKAAADAAKGDAAKGKGGKGATAAANAVAKDGPKIEVETRPVDTAAVETEPVKTADVETDPVQTPADDNSPEDRAAEAATKTTEATS